MRAELVTIFEDLKPKSCFWGTPEWLEMREKLRQVGGTKGKKASKQRKTFKRLTDWGLRWQI